VLEARGVHSGRLHSRTLIRRISDKHNETIFVNGNGVVPFDPGNNRIVVRFKDAGGVPGDQRGWG